MQLESRVFDAEPETNVAMKSSLEIAYHSFEIELVKNSGITLSSLLYLSSSCKCSEFVNNSFK